MNSLYSSGQNTDLDSVPNAIYYREGFYTFYYNNPDSALYYAQKMAEDSSNMTSLREMIHEDFYMMFHEKAKQNFKNKALKENNHHWEKYILSCANNLMAKRYIEKGDFTKAGVYFKKAFDLSPDVTDLRYKNKYFNDAYFLSDGENKYLQTDYLNYLETYGGSNSQILASYVDLAIKDPLTYKEKLRQIFDTSFQGEESFTDFWLNEVNSRFEKTPLVDLQKIGGGSFSSLKSMGKWILIDFWGTWCGPCREEHPILQKFNDELVENPQNNIDLFTIACNDTEEKVKSYMAKYNYSFPVAMSNGIIKKAFNITGYPTKVLVTPQGKFIIIPFGTDWVNFIKKYASI